LALRRLVHSIVHCGVFSLRFPPEHNTWAILGFHRDVDCPQVAVDSDQLITLRECFPSQHTSDLFSFYGLSFATVKTDSNASAYSNGFVHWHLGERPPSTPAKSFPKAFLRTASSSDYDLAYIPSASIIVDLISQSSVSTPTLNTTVATVLRASAVKDEVSFGKVLTNSCGDAFGADAFGARIDVEFSNKQRHDEAARGMWVIPARPLVDQGSNSTPLGSTPTQALADALRQGMQEALGTPVDIADGNAIYADTKEHSPLIMRILTWAVTTPYFRARYTDMDDVENRKRHHKKNMRVLLLVHILQKMRDYRLIISLLPALLTFAFYFSSVKGWLWDILRWFGVVFGRKWAEDHADYLAKYYKNIVLALIVGYSHGFVVFFLTDNHCIISRNNTAIYKQGAVTSKETTCRCVLQIRPPHCLR